MKMNGSCIHLRELEHTDVELLLQLELENQEFFRMYSSTRENDYYTLKEQMNRIEKNKEKRELDQYYFFGIFHNKTLELIGTIMLSEVLRGSLQSCFIGYALDKKHNGKGYTTEAVKLLVAYAFNELKLHRIEAGVMPHNIASIKVLEKSGFHKEGIAKKNVKINGRWEDHQVLAIINENDEI